MTLAATIADGALPAGYGSVHHVRAVLVMRETYALATALAANAHANLVLEIRLGAGRNQPLACAQVLELFAVHLEETEPPKYVGGRLGELLEDLSGYRADVLKTTGFFRYGGRWVRG